MAWYIAKIGIGHIADIAMNRDCGSERRSGRIVRRVLMRREVSVCPIEVGRDNFRQDFGAT